MKDKSGLTLTRTPGEVIMIGEDIMITYVERVGGNQIRLNIKAPPNIIVKRKELLDERRI